jgi:hypothetical protein
LIKVARIKIEISFIISFKNEIGRGTGTGMTRPPEFSDGLKNITKKYQ